MTVCCPARTADSHLNRTISTNCCLHTVCLLMTGCSYTRPVEVWRNILKINCASSWFFFTRIYQVAWSTRHKIWTKQLEKCFCSLKYHIWATEERILNLKKCNTKFLCYVLNINCPGQNQECENRYSRIYRVAWSTRHKIWTKQLEKCFCSINTKYEQLRKGFLIRKSVRPNFCVMSWILTAQDKTRNVKTDKVECTSVA